MDFNAFVISLGFDPTAITETQRLALQAQWRRTQNPPADPPVVKPPVATSFEEEAARIEANNRRVEAIQARGLVAMREHAGDSEKTRELRALVDAAIADSTSVKDFELGLVRANRFSGPNVHAPARHQMNDLVIEAALSKMYNRKDVEKQFSPQTLEMADRHFRHGLSIKDLYALAAERNGNYRGSSRDYQAICNAAFPRNGQFLAASGNSPSTINVTGILSNYANKFLAAVFNYGEQSWRELAKIKTANDFKQMTTYRLTGANKFKKIPKGGEIKQGTLGELSYTNQVETFGIMLGIDRQDYRNDDLGAFNGVMEEIGRGAIDATNEEFWTEWLDDALFFPTDGSLANYDNGDPDSILSLIGLDNADSIFASQTKPDGTPLGLEPRLLLVPRTKRNTADNLMKGTVTAGAQSTPTVTVENVFAGRYRVVSSVYLQSTAIAGSSSLAWYLVADPNECPAIEVAFLDGRDTPTIESSEFDFSRLGVSMRAYLDFGIAKQEYRAAVKLKGAA